MLARVAVFVLCILCIAASPRTASAQATDSMLPDPREMARVEASVDRALEYLVKTQNADGSWPSANNRNGVTALCLLAFLGRGHEPGRGPYQMVVDRAVQYLQTLQNENGFFPQQMYDHALTTLALTEAYGFVPSLELGRSIQRAVDLIIKSQSPRGGWRYNPVPADADLSVTVMQVVALRAAQNARFDVPQSTIDAAINYVRSVADPRGGFGYTSPTASPSQSAAGTLSMQLLGRFDDPTVAGGLDYLRKNPFKPDMAWFYYATYYAMQAHFQAGGDHWESFHPIARENLLSTQNEDGSWPGFAEQSYNGPAQCYSTALGAMTLSVYMHYLPAYQR